MHVVDQMRDWAQRRSHHRADEALRAADEKEREIDRITGEISAGAAILRTELDHLANALQGRGR